MTAPKHKVTAEEAIVVRWIAEHNGELPEHFAHAVRIFMPDDVVPGEISGTIRIVEATGRASCRECGQPIAKSDDAIVFGFDPYAHGETAAEWGRLAKAWIHRRCPQPEEGTS